MLASTQTSGRVGSSRTIQLIRLAAALATLASCSVDTRSLQVGAESGGSAGSVGGTGGAPVGPPPPPAREDCSYIGDKVDEGCETLVSNAGFDESASDWPPETLAISVGWDVLDATESNLSGSIVVDNKLFGAGKGEVMSGALQCLEAFPGGIYDVVADVFIPEGQSDGRAGVNVLLYETTDCNTGLGGTDKSFTSELISTPGEWTRISGRFTADVGVNSMEVRLVAVKPFEPRTFKAHFDNVLVQIK